MGPFLPGVSTVSEANTNRFVIQLVNPTAFSEDCNKARTAILRIQNITNDLRLASESKTKCASKISRLAKLWIPFGKTLTLHGVIFEGEVITSEPAKTLALGAAWQPTFDAQEFDEQAATQYLQELGNIGEYNDNSMAPDFFSYRRAVRNLRNKPNSFPGPDFLPYAAWAASGSTGVQCLLNCDHHLREGNEAHFSKF